MKCLVSLLSLLILSTVIGHAQVKREFRASWITTVANLDWPSQPGLSAEAQQAEFISLLDRLQALGMNAIILQVRPAGSVLFDSSFEPWCEYLSGTQGVSPGYDPLAFAIQQAHQRGMELHAWLNPFRADYHYDPEKPLARNHLFRTYPEWLVQYGPHLYMDPGIPDARTYVIDLIEEMVRRYDVDAVHLDDYFYPYPIDSRPFNDSVSYAMFGRSFMDKDAWRRDNINQFVRGLRDRLLQTDPLVKFGISPFGIWRNQQDDPRGSATQAGIRTYDDLHADVLYWIESGWLDYVAPQLYFSQGFRPADFRILLNWWAYHTKNVHLYIGHAAYKVGNNSDPNWSQPDELYRQVEAVRRQALGSIFFRSQFLLADPLDAVSLLQTQSFQRPALIPPLTYVQLPKPVQPARAIIKARPNGLNLDWIPSPDSSAYHVIYRAEGKQAPDTSAYYLYKIIGHQGRWVDPAAKPFKKYSYLITTVSKQHIESQSTAVLKKRNWWSWLGKKKS